MSVAADAAELLELARSPSRALRDDLIARLADLFMANEESWNDREAVLFDEAITALIGESNLRTRGALSEKVADCRRGLSTTHRTLAVDEIPVAAPVLRRSALLDEPFMIQVAWDGSDEHRLAIGQRETLGEGLSDTLVSLGDGRVKRQVAGNGGARLSKRAFELLAEFATQDEALRTAVTSRPDVPAPIAARLIDLLPPQRRQSMQALLEDQPDEAIRLIGAAKEKLDQDFSTRRHRRLEVRLKLKEIEAGSLKRSDLIVELADHDRALDLAMVLSSLTDLPEAVMTRSLLSVNAEPIACVCRLLDLDESAVAAIARLRGRRLRLPDSMHQRLMQLWRSFDVATARETLGLVRLRAGT